MVPAIKKALHDAFDESRRGGRYPTLDRVGKDGPWVRINHPDLGRFEVRAVANASMLQAAFGHELRDAALNNRILSDGNMDVLNRLASRFSEQLKSGLPAVAGFTFNDNGLVVESGFKRTP